VKKIFAVFLSVMSFSLTAQMRFRHLKAKDGLSQSSVNFVIKDKKGFYWIGTQYGLNRFDGKTIKTYYKATTPHLADNFLIHAIKDDFSNLWLATRNNLSRYNPETNEFTEINPDSLVPTSKGHNSVYHLYKDEAGNIIFNSGSYFFRVKKNQLNQKIALEFLFKDKHRYNITFLNDQFLYAISNDTLVKYAYSNSQPLMPIYRKILAYKLSGNYYNFKCGNRNILLNSNRLFEFKNDSLFEILAGVFKNTIINYVKQINDNYFVATDNGLYEFSSDYRLIRIYNNTPENSLSLSENKVLSISETEDGIVWFGNANTGLSIFDKKANDFDLIKPNPNKPYIPICCYAINDSVLLVGTGIGVDKFMKYNTSWQLQSSFFQNHKATAMVADNETIFIGTPVGLYRKQGTQIAPLPLQNPEPTIFDLKVNKQNQLIVASNAGVFVVDVTANKIVKHIHKNSKESNGKASLPSNYIFNTTFKKNGAYIFNSTMGASLFSETFEANKNYFDGFKYVSLSEIMITKSLEHDDGTIFFGSLGNGVYKMEDKSLRHFNAFNGLSNDVIASMELDNEGNIWTSSNFGISNIQQSGKISSYTDALVLESPEFVTNGSCRCQEQLFFCSTSGVVTFSPKKIMASNTVDKLTLVPLHFIKNYTDTLSLTDSIIHLNHDDKIFAFNFCVPSYRSFNKVKLSYRLINFDDKTHNFENGRGAEFTNLSFKTYTLEVKAELAEQQLITSKRYIIIVAPPFWQQTWFIILSILTVIGLVVLCVWYISRRKLKKQLLQLQIHQKVYEEKERISKDLHDNIGSQISTLIMGLDKISLSQKTESAERLSDYARNTLGELRETIWALNNEELNVKLLKEKLEGFIFDCRTNYEIVKIDYKFDYSVNALLHPQNALTFYRIIQEAINNALKHSLCSNLALEVKASEQFINATIKDNGKGFDTSLRKKGHYGLENMQARAKQAEIMYELRSELHKGTEITLSLKF
jgi:signal transduction histidine kinase/ligand-binding sensor domain-containing protein